jgi:hypothetical protein
MKTDMKPLTETYTGPSNARLRADRQAERCFKEWQHVRDDDESTATQEAAAWAEYVASRTAAERTR